MVLVLRVELVLRLVLVMLMVLIPTCWSRSNILFSFECLVLGFRSRVDGWSKEERDWWALEGTYISLALRHVL